MKNNNSGFTLIELTIAIIIIGLIVAGAAQTFHLWLMQHRLDVTRDRMAAIEATLVRYVQENGDLPCAAPRVERTDPGYGRETDCTGAVHPSTIRADGRGGRKVRIGGIPVRTLDLPDEYRMDGWYRPYTYAVTEMLASASPLFDSTQGAVLIVDEHDTPVVTPPGSALYVVVSHGYGGDVSCSHSAPGMDAENCNNDAKFRAGLFSTAENSGFFDDFIAYATDIDGSTMSNMERCDEKGMQYAPSDPAADAEGCIFAPSLADVSCPAGQAIIGFSGGTAQCAAVGGTPPTSPPPPSCPTGTTWNGTVCVAPPPPPSASCGVWPNGSCVRPGQCPASYRRCVNGTIVTDWSCSADCSGE